MRKLDARTILVKPKIASYLCKMYELRHENLNAFLGLLNSSADGLFKQPQLVWDFGSHGSLMQVIEGETIQMDWTFKLSLLLDLARVKMIYFLPFLTQHETHTSKKFSKMRKGSLSYFLHLKIQLFYFICYLFPSHSSQFSFQDVEIILLMLSEILLFSFYLVVKISIPRKSTLSRDIYSKKSLFHSSSLPIKRKFFHSLLFFLSLSLLPILFNKNFDRG